ncbi:hypothetical protein BT96DRAFT_890298 [Gymnopus androsaceus JB14]|uniref:Uncharacterized protein n=1 Tax=Gymnopus androsaceus JB14 TaxID=1447944 RepID=A0A6A4GSZ8_9AGAR|nr:hypothetical protein BT96DRAFT_890298 [Gymnopus androsaceus JB14]
MSRKPSNLLFFLGFLLICIKISYTWLVLRMVPYTTTSIEPKAHTGVNPSMTWNIGDLGSVILSFEETSHYQIQGQRADEEWAALAPNGGVVYLGENHDPFTPSMFHQLRCLDIIRKDIVRVRGSENPVEPLELTQHCMNYLRQMVLCRSDVALEYCAGKPHVEVFPLTYECQDWRQLYSALEVNQASLKQMRVK